MMKKALFSLTVFLIVAAGFGLYARSELRNLRNQENQKAALEKKQDVQVTLIEGWRREQIAIALDRAGICTYSSFMAASDGKEGELFPDTYRFFPNTSATEVVQTLLDNFQNKTASLNPTLENLTLASIVEREAQNDSERATIAGVYSNRLKQEMLLQADPTVTYAKDGQAIAKLEPKDIFNFKFWAPINQEDYKGVIDQYNTYLNQGLPPGPIANPGIKSIEAAINPEVNQYLYFLHKNGQLLLSKTLAEQQANED